ncbi:MAG: hypothetical protein WDZ82_00935 [Candidatus Paceibacterota bacterium]
MTSTSTSVSGTVAQGRDDDVFEDEAIHSLTRIPAPGDVLGRVPFKELEREGVWEAVLPVFSKKGSRKRKNEFVVFRTIHTPPRHLRKGEVEPMDLRILRREESVSRRKWWEEDEDEGNELALCHNFIVELAPSPASHD